MTTAPVHPVVLIIDDMPSNLGLVVSLLENQGCRVSIAQDGEEGLQRAGLLQPDLILLDAMMPGIDGFETCRRLKRQVATRDIPVIFMTALTMPEHKVSGFQAGAVDYVTKPLQMEEVLARIETHLKLRTAQRALEAQNAELEKRVAERTAELAARERELESSRQQIRELATHRERAREDERKRIARELHDELGQMLTALRMDIMMLSPRFGAGMPGLEERTQHMIRLVDNTIQTVRDVVSMLRPSALDMGIGPALEWLRADFVRYTGIGCEVVVPEQPILLEEEQSLALFRIAQESLTNVARHARATQVNLSFGMEAGNYLLEVRDNGVGFDAKAVAAKNTFGLLGMRERVLGLGGTVSMSSEDGKGTILRVVFQNKIGKSHD